MRKLYLIGGGLLLILIGLGFVFPQLANLRMNGSLVFGQLVMLLMGGAVAISGLASMAYARIAAH